MLAVRARAERAGADEAVILSPEGLVVEGAYSAVMWWRGDSLCMPAPELDRIDSVTARVVREVAVSRGVPARSERAAVEDLSGTEVWVLNALHGIRVVTEWIGGPPLTEVPGRVDRWRRDFKGLRRPLA
jgi:branched-subunit amino acid aminotransferase/4-amino-4-deoxychorismate lyase